MITPDEYFALRDMIERHTVDEIREALEQIARAYYE